MCTSPIFQHSCGCQKPFTHGLERCDKALKQDLEECDDVKEEITEDPYPCLDCFEKQQDSEFEEQLRTALTASGNHYSQQAEAEVEEQMKVVMAESVEEHARRAEQQEEEEMEMMLKTSLEGVNLEDRWEVDGHGFRKILLQSQREYFEKQEDDLKARGLVVGNKPMPRGEWTQRETIHDRPSPSSGGSGSIVDRPGPSRRGPAKAHTIQLPQQYDDDEGEDEEVRPLPPHPTSETGVKRLEDYPPNVGLTGLRHPLILYHYMGCNHDIEAGIDYNKEVAPNEANAIRRPMPGKCSKCGGRPPPSMPGENDKGKGKSVEPLAEVSGSNNVLPPEPPVEKELTPQELRAKRFAIWPTKSNQAGPS